MSGIVILTLFTDRILDPLIGCHCWALAVQSWKRRGSWCWSLLIPYVFTLRFQNWEGWVPKWEIKAISTEFHPHYALWKEYFVRSILLFTMVMRWALMRWRWWGYLQGPPNDFNLTLQLSLRSQITYQAWPIQDSVLKQTWKPSKHYPPSVSQHQNYNNG